MRWWRRKRCVAEGSRYPPVRLFIDIAFIYTLFCGRIFADRNAPTDTRGAPDTPARKAYQMTNRFGPPTLPLCGLRAFCSTAARLVIHLYAGAAERRELDGKPCGRVCACASGCVRVCASGMCVCESACACVQPGAPACPIYSIGNGRIHSIGTGPSCTLDSDPIHGIGTGPIYGIGNTHTPSAFVALRRAALPPIYSTRECSAVRRSQ
jgi:hypothetical protein